MAPIALPDGSKMGAAGLKLDRAPAILIGAVLVAILALVFDFLSALAQKYLKPKGL